VCRITGNSDEIFDAVELTHRRHRDDACVIAWDQHFNEASLHKA
jgi:hypothetical protein